MADDLEADLDRHLTEAAIGAGAVPLDVGRYVEEGCHEDASFMPPDVDTLPRRAARWEIDDEGAAMWAMRKAADAKTALDRIAALYKRQRATLDDWRDTACGPHTRTQAFMAERLAAYALARRAADENAKTLNLPDGVVRTTGARRPGWKVEVVDEVALLAWAVADGRDDMIRPALRPKTDWLDKVNVVDKDGELRVLDGAGEVVPGVVAEPTAPTATVTPAARP